MESYQIQAFNDAEHSENKIHSDTIAKRYGFEGALVAGVVVFGHLTYPLVKEQGLRWLTNNTIEVKFIKPAYHGNWLTIDSVQQEEALQTSAYNEQSTLLAILDTYNTSETPQDLALVDAPTTPFQKEHREEIHWDKLKIGQPESLYLWKPDQETNLQHFKTLRDDLAIYHEGDSPCVHPFWMLRECNSTFSRSFILPAWIHTASKITFHSPLRVSQEIEIRMVPIKKWEKKGHQITTLYISFVCEGQVMVEVEHSAIFNVGSQPG